MGVFCITLKERNIKRLCRLAIRKSHLRQNGHDVLWNLSFSIHYLLENNTKFENFKHIVIEDLNHKCHTMVIYRLSLYRWQSWDHSSLFKRKEWMTIRQSYDM
jgi:hypothetical protein